MNRVTPFNTGKLKIGCYYQPPARLNTDTGADMERLQTALLAQRGSPSLHPHIDRAALAISAAAAAICLVIAFTH